MKITTVLEWPKGLYQNKKITIPLFWKFTIANVLTILTFGSVNLYINNYIVYDVFEDELKRHLNITTINIAEKCIDPILYDDLAYMNSIVSDHLRIDSNIAYIFIIDKNMNILAHTFEETVPEDLIRANILSSEESNSSIKIKPKDNLDKSIHDIAVPILHGSLGVVRLGLYEGNYIKSMKNTTNILLFMILIFLFFGIIGAIVFSYLITTPIKSISKIAENIELGTLDFNEEDVEISLNRSEIVKWKNILNIQDEIDILIMRFGEMVSRLKYTYKDLKETQTSLFQSEKMNSLDTLAAGLAHEINNPLSGIQSCIRRIISSPDNIKQNILYFDMMTEAIREIEEIVERLLHFSRKSDIVFKDVNLKDIIEYVLKMTRFQFERSRIAIRKNNDILPDITADSSLLKQVVLNLVLNSIDAIEEKRMSDSNYLGEIHFQSLIENEWVGLEISDNGIGVPEDNLASIFDPFFSLKKVRQGTGLGLSVCYNIVKQNNGKINVRINSEGGLSVKILFPITKVI